MIVAPFVLFDLVSFNVSENGKKIEKKMTINPFQLPSPPMRKKSESEDEPMRFFRIYMSLRILIFPGF
jgi:hypothetical protein